MNIKTIDLQSPKNYNEALMEKALLQLLTDVANDDFEGIVELFEKVEPTLLEGYIDEELLNIIKGENYEQ